MLNQKFLHLSGHISPNKFRKTCATNDIDPTKTGLIFPGNNTHHYTRGQAQSINMPYTLKGGLGLAKAAAQFNAQGFPTFSLPTTFFGAFTPAQKMALAKEAVADLWRAVGYGMNLALPIRQRGDVVNEKDADGNPISYFPNHHYFSLNDGLGVNLEPNFFGGEEKGANKPLADYYLQQLVILQTFLNNPNPDPAQVPPEFQEAYRQGQEAKQKKERGEHPGNWFVPPQRQAPERAADLEALPAQGRGVNQFVPAAPRPPNLLQEKTLERIQQGIEAKPEQGWQYQKNNDAVTIAHQDNGKKFTITENKISTTDLTNSDADQPIFDKMAETLKTAGITRTLINAPNEETFARMKQAADRVGVEVINIARPRPQNVEAQQAQADEGVNNQQRIGLNRH